MHIQNNTKKSLGQLLPTTVQYISLVTYQLFTIVTWNKVIKLDAKSLKFIRYQSGGVEKSRDCAEEVVIRPLKKSIPNSAKRKKTVYRVRHIVKKDLLNFIKVQIIILNCLSSVSRYTRRSVRSRNTMQHKLIPSSVSSMLPTIKRTSEYIQIIYKMSS